MKEIIPFAITSKIEYMETDITICKIGRQWEFAG